MVSQNNSSGCLIIILLWIICPIVAAVPILIIPVILIFVLFKGLSSIVSSTSGSRSTQTFQTFDDDYREVQVVHSNKKRKSQTGDECWIKKGQSIEIQGFKIPNGLIYVGEYLYTQRSLSNSYYVQVESCLINPKLSISKSNVDIKQNLLSYYPSYSEASSQARANYLHWLSTGASDPDVQIGYVFLYFYGLERRFFLDKASFEWSVIMEEVERLKEIYSDNGSFQHYSNEFLSKAKVVSSLQRGECLYKDSAIEYYETWQTPLDIRVALGQMTKEGVPISAQWALAWIYTDEQTFLRTPAKRAKKEFHDLFMIKFNQQFPNGLMLKPNKRRISANYRAASSSFEVSLNIGSLPDVCMWEDPKAKIRVIVEECTNQLDQYSRLLGRDPNKIDSLEATLLLPTELQEKTQTQELTDLNNLLIEPVKEGEICSITGKKILKLWPSKNDSKLSKKESENLSNFLKKYNIGIVPDVIYGEQVLKSTDIAILFKLSDDFSDSLITEGYKSASLFLELAMTVALADSHFSESEATVLSERLENAFKLSDFERQRLEFKIQYFVENKENVEKIRKNVVDQIPKDRRPEIALHLLALAGADGKIDPSEVKALSKIYKYFGFSDEKLYGDLNEFGAKWSYRDEPITVKKGEKIAIQYGVPESHKDEEKVVTLDMNMVHDKVKDTEEVTKLLAGIFVAEDIAEEQDVREQESDTSDDGLFAELEKPYQALLRELLTRQQWKQDEFKKLAESFSLLSGGAIEVINNWAFDKFDEPLIEEEEDLTINMNILNEASNNG